MAAEHPTTRTSPWQSWCNLLDRLFSSDRNTVRQDVGRLVAAVAAVRSVHPGGAAVIFALAWLAGWLGSMSALLVAAALLVGLHLAKQPERFVLRIKPGTLGAAAAVAGPFEPAGPAGPPTATQSPETAGSAPAPNSLEALVNSSGLKIKRLEFCQPSTNGRTKGNPTEPPAA